MINNAGEVSKYKYSLVGGAGIDLKPEFRESLIVLGQDSRYENAQSMIIIRDAGNASTALFSQAMRIRDRCIKDGHDVKMETAESSVISILWQGIQSDADTVETEDASEIQRFFLRLLENAMDEGASDIHIEVRREKARLRYRINGELVGIDELPTNYATQVAQVVYSVMAEETDVTFKPDQPQDGVIDRQFGDERLRVRLATIPAAPDGFDMVMRLLPIGKADGQAEFKPINELGYADDQVRMINAGVAKPVGLTVVAGTTGSGKSTTLKHVLMGKINAAHGSIKVITVEDPPEYFIPGATQVPVVRRGGKENENPFAAAIRAAMRSDPNILMVGEVRDKVSCDLLTNAVQSGHQVMSTVHASSAIGIIGRLANMGLRRDILGSPDFLGCLIYQKLLPTLCQHCSVPITDKAALEKLNIDDNMMNRLKEVCDVNSDGVRFRNHGNDCEHCRYGVVGRAVVAEVILPDPDMLDLIYDGRDMEAWKHWRKHGGKAALDHAIDKMQNGIVSPGDVEAELGPVTSLKVMEDGIFDMKEEIEFVGPGNRAANEERKDTGLSVELPALDEDGFAADSMADEPTQKVTETDGSDDHQEENNDKDVE